MGGRRGDSAYLKGKTASVRLDQHICSDSAASKHARKTRNPGVCLKRIKIHCEFCMWYHLPKYENHKKIATGYD